MRALTNQERDALALSCGPVHEQRPSDDPLRDVCEALRSRGLLRIESHRAFDRYIITDLGRLALRVALPSMAVRS